MKPSKAAVRNEDLGCCCCNGGRGGFFRLAGLFASFPVRRQRPVRSPWRVCGRLAGERACVSVDCGVRGLWGAWRAIVAGGHLAGWHCRRTGWPAGWPAGWLAGLSVEWRRTGRRLTRPAWRWRRQSAPRTGRASLAGGTLGDLGGGTLDGTHSATRRRTTRPVVVAVPATSWPGGSVVWAVSGVVCGME